MCYVSKQEGGQYYHQEHLARPLEARIWLYSSLFSNFCPKLVLVLTFLTWDGLMIWEITMREEVLGQQEEELGKASLVQSRRWLTAPKAALAFGAALPSCGINVQWFLWGLSAEICSPGDRLGKIAFLLFTYFVASNFFPPYVFSLLILLRSFYLEIISDLISKLQA